MGTVFQNKKVEVRFLDYFIAFDDVGMVKLLVNFHLFFQQLQILRIFTNLSFVNDFNCKLLSRISCQSA